MYQTSETETSDREGNIVSNKLQVMIEEYKSIQDEIRLADSLYMQSFAFGFTGIAAVIGVFIGTSNFIMQIFSVSFLIPIICTILSFFLFLHQEHVRYAIFNLYISEYMIDSILKNSCTIFARTIIRTSRIIKSINSRKFLSISPIIIMHAYQFSYVAVHLYSLIIQKAPLKTIEGLTKSQYLIVITLELIIPFVFLIIWYCITRKMRKNIKTIKNKRKEYFSD